MAWHAVEPSDLLASKCFGHATTWNGHPASGTMWGLSQLMLILHEALGEMVPQPKARRAKLRQSEKLNSTSEFLA